MREKKKYTCAFMSIIANESASLATKLMCCFNQLELHLLVACFGKLILFVFSFIINFILTIVIVILTTSNFNLKQLPFYWLFANLEHRQTTPAQRWFDLILLPEAADANISYKQSKVSQKTHRKRSENTYLNLTFRPDISVDWLMSKSTEHRPFNVRLR